MLQPHLKIDKINRHVIFSGNPDRLPIITEQCHDVVIRSEHRGLHVVDCHTPNNLPITLIATGMGTGSSTIAFEEAYRAGGRVFIRVGSTGSLQPPHPLGSIFVPEGAIRDEGTSTGLVDLRYPAIPDAGLRNEMLTQAKRLNIDVIGGLVWTTDIYYQPDRSTFTKWANIGATCVEMESSALFVNARLKGDCKAATILSSDGNLNEELTIYSGGEEAKKVFDQAVDDSIRISLAALEQIQ